MVVIVTRLAGTTPLIPNGPSGPGAERLTSRKPSVFDVVTVSHERERERLA
jgi:hypothetical protein